MAVQIGQIPGGGLPYGDIYTVGTPHIDQLGSRLYEEQKQREVIRQKQAQALDEEFAKNISNIKDSDIPEYTKKYQDWKKSKMELMKMKPGKQEEFIAKQMDTQRKLADVYTLGNLSKRYKDEEEELSKDYNKNPNNYDDNAMGYLSARRQLPSSQLSQYKSKNKDGKDVVIDLSNPETFRYKGSNTDFGKILADAAGQPKQVYQEESNLDGGMQTKITPYLYGNSPAQVKDRLLGSFALHQAGRDAEHQWDTIPDKEKADTLEAFKTIPADRWKKMGIDQPQDLLPKNADSKAEKLASLMAMQYALSNEPKQATPIFRDNKAAIKNDQQAFELKKLAIQNANAKDLVRLHHELTKGDKEMEDVWIDSYIDKIGSGSTEDLIYHDNGKEVKEKSIPMDAVLSKSLLKHGVEPSDLTITSDGKYRPIYYKHTQNGDLVKSKREGGGYVVDTELSVPITREQLKLSLGAKSVTPTQRTKEMNHQQSQSPVVSHSRDEFKSAGWTDEQIDKAVKAGKINIK